MGNMEEGLKDMRGAGSKEIWIRVFENENELKLGGPIFCAMGKNIAEAKIDLMAQINIDMEPGEEGYFVGDSLECLGDNGYFIEIETVYSNAAPKQEDESEAIKALLTEANKSAIFKRQSMGGNK